MYPDRDGPLNRPDVTREMLVAAVNDALQQLPPELRGGGACRFEDLSRGAFAALTLTGYLRNIAHELQPPFAIIDGRPGRRNLVAIIIMQNEDGTRHGKVFNVLNNTIVGQFTSTGTIIRTASDIFDVPLDDFHLEKMTIVATSPFGPHFVMLECMLRTIACVPVPTAPWDYYTTFGGRHIVMHTATVNLIQQFPLSARYAELEEQLGVASFPSPPQGAARQAVVHGAKEALRVAGGRRFNYVHSWPEAAGVYAGGDLTMNALSLCLYKLCEDGFVVGDFNDVFPCMAGAGLNVLVLSDTVPVSAAAVVRNRLPCAAPCRTC